ncbi:Gfo/Idh/MocA family protein [Anaerocolumna xylanovorans]|nr:Gfo/Idh/MocA family oxidoreductase [Anaerocolumna xylanovorans]
MKLAVIGAGQRGMIYAKIASTYPDVEITAVAEPSEERRNFAAESLDLSKDMLFDNTDAFFHQGRLADAVIIATMDQDHYKQTMKALECGYHILLEKPISPNPAECLEIMEAANAKNLNVIVCHVLRYTNFFMTMKAILDSNELGKVVTIEHSENIGNFHMAHSFVRGNWRRKDLSSPLIMQKSCHDMDILTWLVGSEAGRISSFGNLTYFKEDNAPANSGKRCLDCQAAAKCRFDARKVYLPIAGEWPATAVSTVQTKEGLMEAFRKGPYGRCVYRCDNDVCDNQVTIIEFENGVTASFHLSGFTNRISRTIKVMCEHGEIKGDDGLNTIEVTRFASNANEAYEKRVIYPGVVNSGHGGGDSGLMDDFISLMKMDSDISKSSINKSVESHVMAYAAEQSRISGQVIDICNLKKEIKEEW